MISPYEGPYSKLFSPIALKRLSLQNRLVMLPHGTSLIRDGIPTEGDLAYYQRRAKGVGLVVTGGTVANVNGVVRQRNRVEAFNPAVIETLRRRNQLMKEGGAAVVCQLNHVGRETFGADADFPPISASSRRGPRDPYPPHAMDDAEIVALISGFADSACNMREAGFDGVELHAAHGYLLAQFLSPGTNNRSDRWGGTVEKRCRLLREVVQTIREQCGDAFAIGVRLSAEEDIADGLTLPDTVAIARLLETIDEVEYLSITLGVRGTYVRDMTEPVAPAAPFAARIRSEVGIPVIVGQKIQTPELAEQLLNDGVADMIGMARAFIAEPDLATKMMANEAADVRPCVGLNQDCRAFNPHLHCAVNPQTGRELEPTFAPITKTPKPHSIAIVGGGPAGLEAAWIASARGHSVTIFEQSDGFGGQFLLAASLPRRAGLLRFVDHLATKVRTSGAQICLNTSIDDIPALTGQFDAVVMATGGTLQSLESDEQGRSDILSWADVIRDGAPRPFGSGTAVFADDGTGFWFSYGVAEMLAQAGWQLTFVTTGGAIGGNLPQESVAGVLARLGRSGTRYRVLTGVYDIRDGEADLVELTTGREETVVADLVVRQTGRAANDGFRASLPPELAERVRWIGDCVTPRRISHALLEAQRLARTI